MFEGIVVFTIALVFVSAMAGFIVGYAAGRRIG